MKAIVNGKLVFTDRICDGVLLMENGKIVASGENVTIPENAEVIDAKGLYVGPGLLDQHLHGYSACQDRVDVINDTRRVAELHLKHGTTTMTPSTAYSCTKEDFLKIVDQCVALAEDPNSTVAGIHFEGPFINATKGANSHLAWEYSDEACEMILKAAKGHVLHCTYAPEMPWAEKVEDYLKQYGVVADIGHTSSDAENIYRAVSKGAKIVTHLFDAMGNSDGVAEAAARTGDPQNCVSDIVLSIPDLYYELICDSRAIHVTEVSQRMALRCAGEDHIIVISDCTGRDTVLNRSDYPPEDPRSAEDLNFNLLGQLSGSSLTTSMSAKNFKAATGADMRVVFKCASTNSAKALGLYDRVGSIDEGKDANVIFVDEDFTVKAVYFLGEEVEDIR
ncbi:MAG: N-acetylglucosamine-6-phosphate deacetylase [Clostridia bacterium]|nr:N-acetylglucosamine-6-phosphate deacetylase [Clostridia bacterium]